MSTTVTDTDKGYRALMGVLGDLSGAGVDVGILQDKGSFKDEDSGITLAGYAAVNEFGSEDGHVPERSFLRSTVDERQDEYGRELDRAMGEAVDGAIRGGQSGALAALDRGLGRLGARAARDVQSKIRAGGEPFKKNAPSTLSAKYPADKPLIEEGRMRQSISFAVDLGNGRTGSTGAGEGAA